MRPALALVVLLISACAARQAPPPLTAAEADPTPVERPEALSQLAAGACDAYGYTTGHPGLAACVGSEEKTLGAAPLPVTAGGIVRVVNLLHVAARQCAAIGEAPATESFAACTNRVVGDIVRHRTDG